MFDCALCSENRFMERLLQLSKNCRRWMSVFKWFTLWSCFLIQHHLKGSLAASDISLSLYVIEKVNAKARKLNLTQWEVLTRSMFKLNILKIPLSPSSALHYHSLSFKWSQSAASCVCFLARISWDCEPRSRGRFYITGNKFREKLSCVVSHAQQQKKAVLEMMPGHVPLFMGSCGWVENPWNCKLCCWAPSGVCTWKKGIDHLPFLDLKILLVCILFLW